MLGYFTQIRVDFDNPGDGTYDSAEMSLGSKNHTKNSLITLEYIIHNKSGQNIKFSETSVFVK